MSSYPSRHRQSHSRSGGDRADRPPPPPPPPLPRPQVYEYPKHCHPPPSGPPPAFAKEHGLDQLSTEELQALLNDEDEFLLFLETIPAIVRLKSAISTMHDKNQKLAQDICAMEDEYERLFERASEPVAENPEPPQSLKWSPGGLMGERMHEIEKESDEFVDELISGDMKDLRHTDEWLKRYSKLRQRYHLLAAKQTLLSRGLADAV